MNLFTQLWKEPKIYSVLQLFDSLIKLHIVWYQVQYLASTASSVHPDSESSEEQQQSFVTLGLEKNLNSSLPFEQSLSILLPWESLTRQERKKGNTCWQENQLVLYLSWTTWRHFFQTCSFNLVNGYFQETNVHGSSLYLI